MRSHQPASAGFFVLLRALGNRTMTANTKAKNVPFMDLPFSFAARAGRRLALAALMALAALPALAERADRDQPMNIEADALRYEDQQRLSTFTGNVVATKGTIVMRGAKLEVRQDADGHQSGIMFGAPGKRAFFRQKREGLNEFIEGEADTIQYDGKTDIVRFVKNAEMRRLVGATLQDQVNGDVIVYNNSTEVYTVESAPRGAGGSGGSGRVRAVLAPRAPASQAPAATRPLRSSNTVPAAGAKP